MISLSDGCPADVPTMPVRTLIVDDEDLSLERVRSLLDRDERVEVVGECANGVEALHVIEQEAPDLVFLDIEMPEQSVLAMLAQLRQESSDGQDHVVVHSKERGVFHIVYMRDIESIEVKEGVVIVHAGRETHRSRQTLAEIEASLDAVRFLGVHRSRIVNRSRIQRVEWLLKGEYVIILTSGRRIATGRSYRRVIEAFLNVR